MLALGGLGTCGQPSGGGGGDVIVLSTLEPVGTTLIENSSFAGKPSLGVDYGKWTLRDNSAASSVAANYATVTNDLTSPMCPGQSDYTYQRLTMHPPFTQGTDPIGSIAMYYGSGDRFQTLYLSFGMMHEAGWDNVSAGAGCKAGWIHLLTTGVGFYDAQWYWGFNGDNMQFVFNIQGGPTGGTNDSSGNRDNISRNLGSVGDDLLKSRRGSWVRYEILFKNSSIDTASDGELDVAIDGVHTHHYTDIRLKGVSSGDRKVCGMRLEHTYGGGGTNPASDQFLRYSAFRVLGK